MNEPELLPCPFCGGEAEYRDNGSTGWIECRGDCIHRTVGTFIWRYGEEWKEMEAEDWNRRVYPQEVQTALEKQTPKKPLKGNAHWSFCPACEGSIVNYVNRFCSTCGQRIDWEENEKAQ